MAHREMMQGEIVFRICAQRFLEGGFRFRKSANPPQMQTALNMGGDKVRAHFFRPR
jgi:hypothetical protein